MPPSEITIRPMRDADAAQMLAIHERAVRISCATGLAPEIVEAWLRDRDHEGFLRARDAGGETYLIGERRGLRAAYASWLPGQLVSLFVDPDHQGHGIGRALLAACEAEAAESGAPILKVNATLNARSFYESAGYRPLGDGFEERFGERIPHVRMLRSWE